MDVTGLPVPMQAPGMGEFVLVKLGQHRGQGVWGGQGKGGREAFQGGW